MTDLYTAWLTHLASRDGALVAVAGVSAVFLVSALAVLVWLDDKWRKRMAWLMFGGACMLYYGTLTVVVK
jgi:hypothetical protein